MVGIRGRELRRVDLGVTDYVTDNVVSIAT